MNQKPNLLRATLLAALAASALAACGDRARTDTASTGGSTTARNDATPGASTAAAGSTAGVTAASGTLAAADRNFILTAASSDMMEIEASRLALERTQSAAVRTFAQHMVDEHTKTSERLKGIARDIGVSEPPAMNTLHNADLERLRTLNGVAFDREYAAQVGVAAHQAAVAQFEAAARDVSEPRLKTFVVETLPHLRDHLTQAQALAASVGVPGERLNVANAAGKSGSAMGGMGTDATATGGSTTGTPGQTSGSTGR